MSAYVRQTKLATEYHTCDFDWKEWAAEAEPIVRQQQAQGLQHLMQRTATSASGSSSGNGSASLPTQQDGPVNIVLLPPAAGPTSAARCEKQAAPEAISVAATPAQPTTSHSTTKTAHAVNPQAYEGDKWDDFYKTEGKTTKFYRERRYLLLEFPVLAQSGPLHVVELGCGAGASLLPVLRHNPEAVVTATDIAPTCVQQFHEVAAREGIPNHAQRITSFVADAASPAARHLFQGINADVALIMFTLSAVPPDGQAAMMRNAWEALRPGGLLCIRDHGLFDMVQLRIPPEQWIGAHMYKRGDGTLATFFSVEELAQLAQEAGFILPEPCQYVTVVNQNRKTGQELRRVFVHGMFQKPGAS